MYIIRMSGNMVDRNEIINMVKDDQYNNKELNRLLLWAITKNIDNLFDIIISKIDTIDTINERYLLKQLIESTIEHNNYKTLNFVLDNTQITDFSHYNTSSIISSIIEQDNPKLLRIINDKVLIDYSNHDYFILKRLKNNKQYGLLFTILDKIKYTDPYNEILSDYVSFYRSFKLKRLKEIIYNKKK